MLDQTNHDPSSSPSTESQTPAPDAPATAPSWSEQVDALLIKAAELCADNEVDPDSFMQAAWAACLESRPGLREHLADRQLMQRIDHLRKRGIVGAA